MTKKAKIGTGIIVAAAALITGIIIRKNAQPLQVRMAKVQYREISKTVSISGSIKSNQQVDSAFPTSGTVAKIAVSEGDTVKNGDLLATLNTSNLYSTYLANKAAYEKAKDQLNTFIETYKDDPATAAVNSEDIYWSKYNEYQEAIETAKSTMNASYASLSNAYLYSPISGTVTKVDKEVGEYVSAGTSFIQVADLNNIYFSVNADQEDLGQINQGQKAVLEFDTYPDTQVQGAVANISGSPKKDSTGTNVYEVKISFPKDAIPKTVLGMEGSAKIYLENKANRLSVPSEAIIELNGDNYVFKVINGRAEKSKVIIGFEGDEYTELEEGATENDTVILNPSTNLNSNRPVKSK